MQNRSRNLQKRFLEIYRVRRRRNNARGLNMQRRIAVRHDLEAAESEINANFRRLRFLKEMSRSEVLGLLKKSGVSKVETGQLRIVEHGRSARVSTSLLTERVVAELESLGYKLEEYAPGGSIPMRYMCQG